MNSKTTIQQVALELFSARGYEATGVQEIVKKAQITKPTLYHFFGSKRGLLDAIVSDNYTELNKQLEIAAVYQGDLPATLTRIFTTLVKFAEANPVFFQFAQVAINSSPESEPFEAVKGYYSRSITLLEELFISAVQQHGNMRNRHQRYAFTFLGAAFTYISLARNNTITLNEQAIQLAVHQFSHGIYS